MIKDLKLALFDYDGTIVDSAIMIVEGAIAAFRMCGLPDPDPKKVRENIGKPLAVALDLYLPPGLIDFPFLYLICMNFYHLKYIIFSALFLMEYQLNCL